jgi:hypothetical protein
MSMTIRPVIRFAGGAAMALALWGAVQLALPFLGEPGRQMAVVADPKVIIAAGGRLVDVRGDVVLARSDNPGFAAALYRQGAKLVVEGRVAGGCFRT